MKVRLKFKKVKKKTKKWKIGILLFLISTAVFYIFIQPEDVLASITYYNFTDYNNNKAYKWEDDDTFPPTWSDGWETTTQAIIDEYTNMQTDDDTNYADATPPGNQDEAWWRFNFTINESVSDMDWLYVRFNGLCAFDVGEDADCFVANFTDSGGAWFKVCDIPETDGDCIINFTSDFTKIIDDNNQTVLLCMGNAIDSADPIRADFVDIRVGWAPADITPPTWSRPDVNVTDPHRGDPVNISAVWQDTGTGLVWGWLSTNETGDWVNYTGGTHDSPRSLSGTSPLTVNFTWLNTTGKPRIIGWIMYANDTNNNENGTNWPSGAYEGNFTMWGWSNITWSSPTSGGTYSPGDIIKLTCFVNDTNTTGSGPIGNYTVSFYNKTASAETFIGTNNTNSTGHAVYYWDTTGLSGTFYPKCNITDNATQYYNASEYYEANTSFSIVQKTSRNVTLALSINSPTSSFGDYSRSSVEPIQIPPSISGMFAGIRPITQQLLASQVMGRVIGFLKYLTQSLSLGEIVEGVLTKLRTLTQSSSMNTIISSALSGFRSLTQSLSINDAVVRARAISRALTQVITTNSVVETLKSVWRTLTQALNVTDVSTRLASVFRILTQSLTTNNLVQRLRTALSVLTQAISISNITSRLTFILRTLTQAISSNTVADGIRNVFRTLTQSLIITNITSRLASLLRTLTQAITIISQAIESTVDIYSRIVNLALNISQIVSRLSFISRLLTQSLNLGNIAAGLRTAFRTLTQVLNLSSILESIRNVPRAIAQVISTNTVVTRLASIFRTLTQTISTNTLVSAIRTAFRTLTQALNITDALTRLTSILRTLTQSLTITNITSRLTSIFRTLTQAISSNTVVSAIRTALRALTQTLSLSTITSRLSSILRTLTQAISSNTVVSTIRNVFRTLTQSLTLTGLVQRLKAISTILTQSLSISTITPRLASIFRTLTQVITSNTLISGIRTALRALTQTLSLSNITSRLTSIFRTLTQVITSNTLITRLTSLFRTLTQAISSNTLISAIRTALRALTQSLSLSSITSKLTSLFRTLTQTITITSQAIKGAITRYDRIVNLALNISQIVSRLSFISRLLTQSLTISSITSRLASIFDVYERIVSFAMMISDITSRLFSARKTVTGSFAISDVMTRLTQISRAITQVMNIDVIVSRMKSVFRSVFESISLILRLFFPCSFWTTQSSCESVGCNWCNNACQVQSCGVPAEPVSPGGGGGGIGRIVSAIFPKTSDFTIDKDITTVAITLGETDTRLLEISNTGETELTITARIENLGRFLIFPGGLSEFTFELSPDETKTLQLNFFALEEQEPGIYPGKVVLTVDEIEKVVTIVVEVEPKKPIFDIKVEIPLLYKEIYPGEEVVGKLTLYNLERIGLVDVELEYGIKDTLGNVIISDYETLAVDVQKTITRSFYIPSDVEPGYYVFFAKIRYDDAIGVGSKIFRVMKIGVEMETIVIISIVPIFALTTIIAIILYKRSVRRHRYVEMLESIKKHMRKKE